MVAYNISYIIGNIIGFVIMILIMFVIPGVLTVWNIYNFCSKKPKKEKIVSTLTVFIGGILYLILHEMEFNMAGDWYKKIDTMQIHNSISSDYGWLIWLLILLGLAGFFILLFVSADKLSPLVSVISVATLILLNVFQIAYAIQITRNFDDIELFLYVYHINILIISASVIRNQIRQQVSILANKEADMSKHKMFNWLYGKMASVTNYTIVVFIGLFFIIAILEIIFVLAGQGLDAPIKAFTDTADWTFSKQIPPPPIEYDGHYLCTIAAGGHKNVVKPLRLGTRRGEVIVVNRQLCIANAFEEVIQERFPKFHKGIRSFYDSYGYPVSRHITTPLRADIIYLLMKPLEWAFLIFLYMVDLHPEERINKQYKYRK